MMKLKLYLALAELFMGMSIEFSILSKLLTDKIRKELNMAKYNSKGGRTAAVPMRFTPEEKAALQAAAASVGMSMSDFVMLLLQLYEERIK